MADKHDVSHAWLGRQALLEFISRYRNEQLHLPLRIARGHSQHPLTEDEHAAQ